MSIYELSRKVTNKTYNKNGILNNKMTIVVMKRVLLVNRFWDDTLKRGHLITEGSSARGGTNDVMRTIKSDNIIQIKIRAETPT